MLTTLPPAPIIDHRQLFAPSFYRAYNIILRELGKEYWFAGGRGSTKSTFIALIILLGIMRDAQRFFDGQITKAELTHAMVYRKVGNDCFDSVYAQFVKCINMLSLGSVFKCVDSRLRIWFLPTMQMIRFRGLDDEMKQKSATTPFGYYKYLWFEETSQFHGMAEIRSVIQSVKRGGNEAQVFFSYNPPASVANWVNVEAERPKDGKYLFRSDYRSVPVEWLGLPFIEEAEALKKQDIDAYNHEYLGMVTGTGAEVFHRLRFQRITKEMLAGLPRNNGLDFGFENDPCALVSNAIDRKHHTIYLFYEWVKHGMFEEQIWDAIKTAGMQGQVIVADSSEPRSIARLQNMGARRMAKSWKSADSIDEGYKFLRKYDLVIDPFACPVTAREFRTMSYVRTKDGTVTNKYTDRDNHTIDAHRYALENYIRFGDMPSQF